MKIHISIIFLAIFSLIMFCFWFSGVDFTARSEWLGVGLGSSLVFGVLFSAITQLLIQINKKFILYFFGSALICLGVMWVGNFDFTVRSFSNGQAMGSVLFFSFWAAAFCVIAGQE